MSSPLYALPPFRGRAVRLLVFAAVALVFVASWLTIRTSARAAVPPAPAGLSLIFSDDFDGAANTGLDRANWLYDIGTSYPGGAANWGTGEIERMTDSTANVFHDGDGHLAIKPIRDAAGNWTSGRVETQRTDFAAPAGGKLRVEASIQQPDVSGAAAAGYWSAFWMLADAARPVGATNWPGVGEWDIMESINGRSSQFVTLHCGVAPGGPCNEFTGLSSGETACPGCQTSFHTYAVEYDRGASPETLRWFVDKNNFFTLQQDKVDAKTWDNATKHGFFLILNVAIGGAFPAAFGGGPTAATQPGVPMLVDHVSVFASGGGGSTPPTKKPRKSPRPTTAPSASPSLVPSASAPVSRRSRPSASVPSASRPSASGPRPSMTPSDDDDGVRDAYAPIEAESANVQAGTQAETTTDSGGGQNVGHAANGDSLRFDNVDFGANPAHQFVTRVASGAAGSVGGLVELHLDSPASPPAGSFAISPTGGWQTWRTVPANIPAVTGTHTVYLTFTSGQPADFVNVNWLTFSH